MVDLKLILEFCTCGLHLKLNLQNQEVIWHHETAHPIFEASMALAKFKFITLFITFDDKSKLKEHWKHDKYACMRELYEDLNRNMAKAPYPTSYLSIEETLYP